MSRPELGGKGDSLAEGVPASVDAEVGVAPFAEASPVVVEAIAGEAVGRDEKTGQTCFLTVLGSARTCPHVV